MPFFYLLIYTLRDAKARVQCAFYPGLEHYTLLPTSSPTRLRCAFGIADSQTADFLLCTALASASLASAIMAAICTVFIVDSSGIVLARSSSCDTLSTSDYDTNVVDARGWTQRDGDQIQRWSRQHARDCYRGRSDATACGVFARASLPQIASYDGYCPFPGICLPELSDHALVQDSGLKDSVEDLGLNLPRSKSIMLRQVLTCGVLDGERYLLSEGFIANPQFALGYVPAAPARFLACGFGKTPITPDQSRNETYVTTNLSPGAQHGYKTKYGALCLC